MPESLSILIFALLAAAPGTANPGETERPDFDRFYQEAGVEGAFILYDLEADAYRVYNPERVDRPFLPASTFKIPNSLIALETGVIAGPDEVLPWDGVERWVKSWNRDHDLRSAIRYSAVWYYQELARRIGEKRMRHYLETIGYGNADVGGGIDQFWLDGALRITPRQQIDFLVRLYRGELPFSERTLGIVKDILVLEEGDGWVLRGKTGWAIDPDPPIGWFVGWLEKDGKVYFFANNVDLKGEADPRVRKQIALDVLRHVGLL